MTGDTLPPDARLRRAADFAALRSTRGRVRGRLFMLRYGMNDNTTARLGMAVSRKVSVRAVERNRIKRQVRECFRRTRRQIPRVDILVIAYREAAGQPSNVLRDELDQLLARIQPLKSARATATITG